MSQYPITHTKTIFTNLEYVNNFSFEEHDYNIRNLQHAAVDIEGKTVHILNHHGHHVREHKNGTDDTLRQCQQIMDYIDTLDGPVILAGDFNLSPTSKSIEMINSKLRNLPLEYKLKTTRNHLTNKSEVCDYIFVNDQVNIQNFEMLEDVVSDHAALLLDFNL